MYLSITYFPSDSTEIPFHTLTSTQPPPSTPFEIQFASQHARLVYPTIPRNKLARSEDLQAIKQALDDLGPSCIACWLHQIPFQHDHLLQDCVHCPNPYTTHTAQWKAWRASLKFPEGVCWGCGCLQHVCSISFIIIYFHS